MNPTKVAEAHRLLAEGAELTARGHAKLAEAMAEQDGSATSRTPAAPAKLPKRPRRYVAAAEGPEPDEVSRAAARAALRESGFVRRRAS